MAMEAYSDKGASSLHSQQSPSISTMSKSQRRRLKREQRKRQRELERAQRLRKAKNKRIQNYGIALLIIAAVAFTYWASRPPKDAPIIEIVPSTYSFGTVSQAQGIVTAEMTVYNRGATDLILSNIDSSCGCTSAAVVYNGVEGPRFGMSIHGTNPKNWKQVIPPGQSAQLKVYYNPNVHKELRGAVTRYISVYSNDPRHRVKEVRIHANQVD